MRPRQKPQRWPTWPTGCARTAHRSESESGPATGRSRGAAAPAHRPVVQGVPPTAAARLLLRVLGHLPALRKLVPPRAASRQGEAAQRRPPDLRGHRRRCPGAAVVLPWTADWLSTWARRSGVSPRCATWSARLTGCSDEVDRRVGSLTRPVMPVGRRQSVRAPVRIMCLRCVERYGGVVARTARSAAGAGPSLQPSPPRAGSRANTTRPPPRLPKCDSASGRDARAPGRFDR